MEAGGGGQVGTGRFFCHNCCIEYDYELNDYNCPFCSGGFVELLQTPGTAVGMEMPPPLFPPREPRRRENTEQAGAAATAAAAASTATATAAATAAVGWTPLVGQISDIGVDDMDELPQVTENRWANWCPPWEYRDPAAPSSNNTPLPFGMNDLQFILSGDRIRGFSGTMRLGAAESLLQQIMWQVSGGRVGGPPLLVVGHNPDDPARPDFVVSNDSLDAIMSQLLWNADYDGPPPLPAERIENLPEVNVSEQQVLSKLQCSICWDVYDLDEKVRQLKCGHLYHKGCISPWLSLHATCPICRQSLAAQEPTYSAQQRPPASRDPPDANSNRTGGPYTLASFLQRMCGIPPPGQRDGGEPAAAGSAPANPTPSSSVPFSPTPADAAPHTSETANASATATGDAPNDPETVPPATPAGSDGTRAADARTRVPSINPSHILVMSTPNHQDNSMTEYIAFWGGSSGGGPISSSTVSSTTSDGNPRPSTNFDMELD